MIQVITEERDACNQLLVCFDELAAKVASVNGQSIQRLREFVDNVREMANHARRGERTPCYQTVFDRTVRRHRG